MARYDTSKLPPGIWFVGGGRGGKLYPVTPEGRRTALVFVLGMAGSGLLAGLLVTLTESLGWLALMAVGMPASAIWFVATAKRHGDLKIRIQDLMVKK